MEVYVANAFTGERFGGNPAGVVPLGQAPFPPEEDMQRIAALIKHSETAFVRQSGEDVFSLRYYSPGMEVDLCGHATIAAFCVLREEKALPAGDYRIETRAGRLGLKLEKDAVWLDMAPGRIRQTLPREEALAVYEALGLCEADAPEGLPACVVGTGLDDILLPVNSLASLHAARLNREALMALSQRYDVAGAHLFCLEDPGCTAHCRNFAPLYDIDEECATGTANGALTHYLHQQGILPPGREQRFLQGEAMGRPSLVLSRTDERGNIRIGGGAVIMIAGVLR